MEVLSPPKTLIPKLLNLKKFFSSSIVVAVASASTSAFSNLDLTEWAIQTCKELGMRKPMPVQIHFIPKILVGRDVLRIAQTGSGKTTTIALSILNHLAKDPYEVFARVITPTREFTFQLIEQFRTFGSCLHMLCSMVVGGMDTITQAKALVSRPHVVVAIPGRIKVLLERNPELQRMKENKRL